MAPFAAAEHNSNSNTTERPERKDQERKEECKTIKIHVSSTCFQAPQRKRERERERENEIDGGYGETV